MVDLGKPLSWKNAHCARDPAAAAELAMLNDLQGNILKGHGRKFTSNLFLRFDKSRAITAKALLASFSKDRPTGLAQLRAAEEDQSGGATTSNQMPSVLHCTR